MKKLTRCIIAGVIGLGLAAGGCGNPSGSGNGDNWQPYYVEGIGEVNLAIRDGCGPHAPCISWTSDHMGNTVFGLGPEATETYKSGIWYSWGLRTAKERHAHTGVNPNQNPTLLEGKDVIPCWTSTDWQYAADRVNEM